MEISKNKCREKISSIKKDIDESPNRIKYARKNLESTTKYIKKLKKQNPNFTIEELNNFLYSKVKETIINLNSPTRSDMYLYKTSEYVLKNINLVFEELEKNQKEKYINNEKKSYKYTSDIEKNIKLITEDVITIILNRKTTEFKEKFLNNSLSYEENKELREQIKKALKTFNDIYNKEIKKRYSIKLSNIIRILDEMGFLKKYNERNNKILDNINLPILKYEYEPEKNKCGLTDLKNPEFINRFSLEEIIAMTSFYSNRLTKEVIDYNESLYIVNKIGLIEEILKKDDYKSDITDDELREIISQLEFLKEISKDIAQEMLSKSTKNCENNVINGDLTKSRSREKAIKTYEEDYKNIYENIFLPQFSNDFKNDLDLVTILEADRYNLYSAKNFAIESVMVILTDKNKNINWGYIPENKNGKNTIQNKEKFVLIGIDMKGYNMPIKLHFQREELETFLTNYAKDTKIPLYEGNEDMEIAWNGYMTTQVYMPLTKEQRKQLKETNLHSSDYRYRFIEHIKWMMLPNRYPKYLCDHQGNKKEKRYIDVKTGQIVATDKLH